MIKMQVNRNDLDRLKYLEREINNPHFNKVITSIIHNIQVNNAVYVITEEGSWDYEYTGHTEVYSTFKDAFKEYKQLVKQAKEDIKKWTENIETDEEINEDAEQASFDIYEQGEYSKLHDSIKIEKKEVR